MSATVKNLFYLSDKQGVAWGFLLIFDKLILD